MTPEQQVRSKCRPHFPQHSKSLTTFQACVHGLTPFKYWEPGARVKWWGSITRCKAWGIFTAHNTVIVLYAGILMVHDSKQQNLAFLCGVTTLSVLVKKSAKEIDMQSLLHLITHM